MLLEEGTDTSERPKTHCLKRTLFHKIALRVFLRLVALAIIVLVSWLISIDVYIEAYLTWINSIGLAAAIPLFLGVATLFSTFSPTGYLPTVLSGATFYYPIGWAISYCSVNLAAVANLVAIRHGLRKACLDRPRFRRTKLSARMRHTLSHINEFMSERPLFAVVMLRMPYLGSGVLNYAFSLSSVPARTYFLANAIGFLPGSALFCALGTTARSLFQLVIAGELDTISIVIIVAEALLLLVALVILAWVTNRYRRSQARRRIAEQPIGPPRSTLAECTNQNNHNGTSSVLKGVSPQHGAPD